MSFLNSVLNSIGSPNPQGPIAPPPRQEKPASSLNKPTDIVNDGGKSDASTSSIQRKRKAEDMLAESASKAVKAVSMNGERSKITTPIATLPSSTQPPSAGARLASVSKPSYRGSAKPIAGPSKPQTSVDKPKPVVEAPKKEPKKGSYAEIMARAKQNQAKPPAIGAISHKPKAQIAMSYKQEMKLKKKEMQDKKLGIKKDGNSHPSSAGSTGPNSPGLPKPSKDVPQAKPVSHKPKPQPLYKGTMNPASNDTALKPKNTARPTKQRRRDEYVGTDEELDEDEDDGDGAEEDDDGYGYGDEEGYDDESSDDMEAGFDDVEAEESVAAKEARKEDDREAALEAKLKGEKEERKRKMMALAKKAKPQKY